MIPFGDSIRLFGRDVPLRVADLNVGILFIFAMSAMGVYGIALAGWSSNNKYSLMGGMRSSAQLISYELAMGLSAVGVLMAAGSLRLTEVVLAQDRLLALERRGASPSGRSSSSSPPSPRPTASPSTCRSASRSWWGATTPSTPA